MPHWAEKQQPIYLLFYLWEVKSRWWAKVGHSQLGRASPFIPRDIGQANTLIRHEAIRPTSSNIEEIKMNRITNGRNIIDLVIQFSFYYGW